MALTKITDTLDAHQSLGNQPNADDGISASDLKILYDRDVNRVKVFINDVLTVEIDATFATKAELVAAIISSAFPAGSIGDVALSNDADQIKTRFSDFVASKGQSNGLATLNSSGVLDQKPYVIGTYTGNGSAYQEIPLDFNPSAVLVNRAKGGYFGLGGEVWGGLAVTGSKIQLENSSIFYDALAIVSGGFRAYYDDNIGGGTSDVYVNNAGEVYNYIAFK